jgi:hypothetical protein
LKNSVYRSNVRRRRARLASSFSSCCKPKAAPISDGSKVPRQLVEDELIVVVDPVEVLPEVALAALRPEEVQLGPPAPAAKHHCAVARRVVVDHEHATVARLLEDRRSVGYPKNVGVVDLLIGFPFEDKHATYQYLMPGIKDKQSHDEFAMPAQYMFKGIPHEICY